MAGFIRETKGLNMLLGLILIGCAGGACLVLYIRQNIKIIDQNMTLINNIKNIIMSQEIYSIPTDPTARYDFQRNVVASATAHAMPWGITDDKIVQIARLSTSYELIYAAANNKKTQSLATTSAREAAWISLEVALVDLYDHYLINNDVISAADKDALHIHAVGGYAVSDER